MPNDIIVPVIEAAPQDAHDETDPVAAVNVDAWRQNVRKEKVGRDVTVGIVDTGVAPNPWFRGEVHGERPSPTRPLPANYKAGHATFIAGLVLQQAPAARIQVRKALDSQGRGTTDAVVAAARELADQGVRILNLSLGCYDTPADRAAFEQLFAGLEADHPDLVVVAAAGNRRDGEQRAFLPAGLADHSRLVSVGAATDPTGATYAAWSNSGPEVTFKVNGTDLVSTYLKFTARSGNPDGRWALWGGTSFAAGLTSGVIAATMSPGDGAVVRTAPEAVARLRQGRTEVPLFTSTFPAPAMTGPITV